MGNDVFVIDTGDIEFPDAGSALDAGGQFAFGGGDTGGGVIAAGAEVVGGADCASGAGSGSYYLAADDVGDHSGPYGCRETLAASCVDFPGGGDLQPVGTAAVWNQTAAAAVFCNCFCREKILVRSHAPAGNKDVLYLIRGDGVEQGGGLLFERQLGDPGFGFNHQAVGFKAYIEGADAVGEVEGFGRTAGESPPGFGGVGTG